MLFKFTLMDQVPNSLKFTNFFFIWQKVRISRRYVFVADAVPLQEISMRYLTPYAVAIILYSHSSIFLHGANNAQQYIIT